MQRRIPPPVVRGARSVRKRVSAAAPVRQLRVVDESESGTELGDALMAARGVRHAPDLNRMGVVAVTGQEDGSDLAPGL